jgi:hypothetical protein
MEGIYLYKVKEDLKKLRDFLSEIYNFIDQTTDEADNYLQTSVELQKTLDELHHSLQTEPLRSIKETISELRQKLDYLQPLINPSFITEINEQIQKFENHLQSEIELMDSIRIKIQNDQSLLKQIHQKIQTHRDSLKTKLEPLESPATIMQRNLSHLEDNLNTQTPNEKINAQIAGDILILSLQLAETLFPPEPNKQPTEDEISIFYKSMSEWIKNLATYIDKMIDYTHKLPQEEKLTSNLELQKNLEHLYNVFKKAINKRKQKERQKQQDEKNDQLPEVNNK